MKESLLDYTLRRLAETKGKWPDISRQSGIEYFWITRLAKGQNKNPSYFKIQKLHDFLKQFNGATKEKR